MRTLHWMDCSEGARKVAHTRLLEKRLGLPLGKAHDLTCQIVDTGYAVMDVPDAIANDLIAEIRLLGFNVEAAQQAQAA